MTLLRGDVVWVDFGEPRGASPAYRRPALVVQADRYNGSRIATVVVAVITSNTALARYEDNVFLPAGTAGLDRDCVVNISQVFTIDREAVDPPEGSLPPSLAEQVDTGLRHVLGL